jgi:Tol biopolymer transport system component
LGLTGKARALWTVRPDGSELNRVVEEGEIACARWSASGDAVFFLRSGGSAPELVKIPIDSKGLAKSAPSVLAGGLEAGSYFTLTADGNRLLYARAQSSSKLWLTDLTGEPSGNKPKTKELITGTSVLQQPRISPDGKWIAFVNMRENANIYRLPIDGGQPTQLTFSNGLAPAWSPDGTQIAFGSAEGGAIHVWTMKPDGLLRQPLSATTLSGNYELTWSPGRKILYQVPTSDNFKIFDPDTGREELLLKGDFLGWIFNPRYSPDRRQVAVWWNRRVRSDIGIYVISVENRSAKVLAKGDLRPVGWSPDGKFVYAFRSYTGELVTMPATGGNPRVIVRLPGRITEGSVSSDGSKIVCSASEETSDVWLMENFDPAP